MNYAYILTPVVTGMWNLGEPHYEGDVYTKNYSVEKWLMELNKGGCTYVYLARIDEQFCQGYEAAFLNENDIIEGMLYKVVQINEKTYLEMVTINNV